MTIWSRDVYKYALDTFFNSTRPSQLIGISRAIMKAIIILAALTALASAAEWTDLRAKWATADPEHLNSFFKIPRTADSAISEGWVCVPDINDHPVSVYCLPQDGRFCIITDSYGNIAGIQISALASDIENKGILYHPSAVATFKKKTIFGDDYWTTTVYTVDPAVIDAGGRPDAAGLTGTTGVWIEQGDSYLTVSRNENTMMRTLNYYKGYCFAQMGTHYYYAMSESLPCTQIEPHFPLFMGDDMLGIGFVTFGNSSVTKRSWYEALDWTSIRAAIPDAPTCFVDWAKEYGIINLHVYFVEEPWNITC